MGTKLGKLIAAMALTAASPLLTSCSPSAVMPGGYTPPRGLSQEDMEVFRTATASSAYESLKPRKVATQVVAGTNFRFTCRGGVTITVFRPLPGRGAPHVTGVQERR